MGRNTIRAGYAAEINARYSRLFPVTEKKSVEFLAETTNLGNRLNVTGLNSTATVDAAGNITTPATLAPNGVARSAPAAIGPALQLVRVSSFPAGVWL